jgi:hypothetical protein
MADRSDRDKENGVDCLLLQSIGDCRRYSVANFSAGINAAHEGVGVIRNAGDVALRCGGF